MRVFQLLDALDYGDAVSNHAIEINNMLIEMGIFTKIYSIYAHQKVDTFRESINEIKVKKDDVIIFHFSGKSSLLNKINRLRCKKVLIYHNITPHHYFEGMEPHYTQCLDGRMQLEELVGMFDLYLGDSQFNVSELLNLGCEPSRVMPIIVDLKIKSSKRKYTISNNGTKFLFVGRVAPNKKHEDVMRIFDYYCTYIDPNAILYFVGNYNDYMLYYEKLLNIRSNLTSGRKIIFTGKVSNDELVHHYKTADVFLCMSEHEGFCVPLLESMSYGLPTFAFDSGAINSTMGASGVLITEKRFDDIAELIDILLNKQEIAREIVEKQYLWLDNFTRAKSIGLLAEILEEVRNLS
ncbi:glycosyltransferase family 4 protein [Paenibacillus sp. Soil724D2]|uniref:glycosyltransferase family 4 protein n=1 Tax=Paenibacillus sp. (strain Soil724D2) TaxID=1736392 RepID=UPI0007159C65|nr:glycosyltransferase family 4 protein [Paenibacillus sp. Soil724D2]KRE51056.1 hypothetical protein ASG85_19050 [Paenibacillus sp. Soil724D2]